MATLYMRNEVQIKYIIAIHAQVMCGIPMHSRYSFDLIENIPRVTYSNLSIEMFGFDCYSPFVQCLVFCAEGSRVTMSIFENCVQRRIEQERENEKVSELARRHVQSVEQSFSVRDRKKKEKHVFICIL